MTSNCVLEKSEDDLCGGPWAEIFKTFVGFIPEVGTTVQAALSFACDIASGASLTTLVNDAVGKCGCVA